MRAFIGEVETRSWPAECGARLEEAAARRQEEDESRGFQTISYTSAVVK